MIVLVAVGLAAVDIITLSSLHSYLYGRVDDQLTAASQLVAGSCVTPTTAASRSTPAALAPRVSPDVYVALIDADGPVVVARPSGTPSGTGRTASPPCPGRSPGRVVAAAPEPSGSHLRAVVQLGHRRLRRRYGSRLPTGGDVVARPGPWWWPPADHGQRHPHLTAQHRAGRLPRTAGRALVPHDPAHPPGPPAPGGMSGEADAIAAGDLSRRVEPSDGDGDRPTGPGPQRDARPDRNGLRPAGPLRGAPAELPVRRLPRAAHAPHLHPWLCRAPAQGRPRDDQARDRALSRIEKEAARMGVLVGDLAVLARAGEGPGPVTDRVDLAAVAADVVADARHHRPPTDPSR